MKIPEIMNKRMSFSFEVFPPKEDKGVKSLASALDRLYECEPDFISCTYGAGGSNEGRYFEILKMLKDANRCTPLAHFTCIGQTRESVRNKVDHLKEIGITHILALRGDLPEGWDDTRGDFSHANELVSFIKAEYGDDFVVAMAAAPEKHIEAVSFEADIAHLRMKQDAGADFIMTQLCYDIDAYLRWLEMIRAAGITIPVDVGVMPVINKDATLKMTLSTNGCSIPRELAELISRWYNDPDGFRKAGKEYSAKLIQEYINCGIDGLHIYTLNKSNDVRDILRMAGVHAPRKKRPAAVEE